MPVELIRPVFKIKYSSTEKVLAGIHLYAINANTPAGVLYFELDNNGRTINKMSVGTAREDETSSAYNFYISDQQLSDTDKGRITAEDCFDAITVTNQREQTIVLNASVKIKAEDGSEPPLGLAKTQSGKYKAVGKQAGGTYEWSITGSKASITGGNTTQIVKINGDNISTAPGDTTLKIKYTIAGILIEDSISITVVEIKIRAEDGSDPVKIVEKDKERKYKLVVTPVLDASPVKTGYAWKTSSALIAITDANKITAKVKGITASSAADDVVLKAALLFDGIQAAETEIKLTVQVFARLKLSEITFKNNHRINEDTLGDFPQPEWQLNRIKSSKPYQSPVCYTCKTKIKFTAKFLVEVKPAPVDDNDTEIVMQTTIGTTTLTAKKKVTVKTTDTDITAADIETDAALPDGVDFYEKLEMEWKTQHPAAGEVLLSVTEPATTPLTNKTQHLFYITLKDPVLLASAYGLSTKLYWTVIDFTCRAAKSKKNDADTAAAIFTRLKTHTGQGNGIKRKRDDAELTYYDPQAIHDNNIQYTTELLTNVFTKTSGAKYSLGRCGCWARFLLDLFQSQGITGGQIAVITIKPCYMVNALNFLVKNWSFNGTGKFPPGTYTAAAFNPYKEYYRPFMYVYGTNTHECAKSAGAAGQGNDNPLAFFGDHGIVKYNGKYYDPSYGVDFTDEALWEQASIAGLAASRPIALYSYPQLYSKGFVGCTVNTATDTWASVAAAHGMTETELKNHPFNEFKDKTDITLNTEIYIPRDKAGPMLVFRVI